MKSCIGCGELLKYPTDHATCLWQDENRDKIEFNGYKSRILDLQSLLLERFSFSQIIVFDRWLGKNE